MLAGSSASHEIPELIRVAAPVHVKFGLRNAPASTRAAISRPPVALSREPCAVRDSASEAARTLGYAPATSGARR